MVCVVAPAEVLASLDGGTGASLSSNLWPPHWYLKLDESFSSMTLLDQN